MEHRQGLYVNNCECTECEHHRKAIMVGVNQGNALPEASRYSDCEPINESLVQFANDRDYTTADLQADPELRKRLTAELAQEAGISHMTPEQQDAWWNGR